jgi:hypothetical protein
VALEGTDVGGEPLLEPVVEDGQIVGAFELEAARERCAADAARVGFAADEE